MRMMGIAADQPALFFEQAAKTTNEQVQL